MLFQSLNLEISRYKKIWVFYILMFYNIFEAVKIGEGQLWHFSYKFHGIFDLSTFCSYSLYSVHLLFSLSILLLSFHFVSSSRIAFSSFFTLSVFFSLTSIYIFSFIISSYYHGNRQWTENIQAKICTNLAKRWSVMISEQIMDTRSILW